MTNRNETSPFFLSRNKISPLHHQFMEIPGSRSQTSHHVEQSGWAQTCGHDIAKGHGAHAIRLHGLHRTAAGHPRHSSVTQEFRCVHSFLACDWSHDRHRGALQFVHRFVGDEQTANGMCAGGHLSAGTGKHIGQFRQDGQCTDQRAVVLQSDAQSTVHYVLHTVYDRMCGPCVLWEQLRGARSGFIA